MPETHVSKADVEAGISAPELLAMAGLAKSRSEGRRLIQQGGVQLGDRRCEEIDEMVGPEHFSGDGTLIVKVGKKRFHRMVIQ
jgi:tyrosyl-tRNA synthetase